jgi:hypothetical protein
VTLLFTLQELHSAKLASESGAVGPSQPQHARPPPIPEEGV